MPIEFEDALKFVLKWEGGFTNHPKDPGGATNKGITQKVYDAWWDLVPNRTKYIVQGNNLVNPEHIRIADNLEQFLEINRIKNPEYAGMLKCGDFYRFMATGVK